MGKLKDKIDWEIAQLAKAGVLEIGPDHPQYTTAGPGYGMVIQSGKRRSKTQMLVVRLTEAANELAVKYDELQLRCDELAEELDCSEIVSGARDRLLRANTIECAELKKECDAGAARILWLEAQCDSAILASRQHKAERDEARQWAAKLYRENDELSWRDGDAYHEQEWQRSVANDLRREKSALLDQLAEARRCLRMVQTQRDELLKDGS